MTEENGRIVISDVGIKASDIGQGNIDLSVETSDADVVTATVNKNKVILTSKNISGNTAGKTAKINVECGSLKETCTVTTVVRPTEAATNTKTVVTTYGIIDIVWLDTNNNIIEEPNDPSNYLNGMKKVTWEEKADGSWKENSTEPATKEEWYDYKIGKGTLDNNKSRWANAATIDSSKNVTAYWVWVPRYAYRVTYYKSYTENEDGTITLGDITGYYDGRGMWDINGTLNYNLDDGIETVDVGNEKYIVHSAFMKDTGKTKKIINEDNEEETITLKNFDRGGWESNLPGIWVAKYEMSGSTPETLKSVPNVESQRIQKIGLQYANARQATYGQTGVKDKSDNYISFMNSHQMKNSEWGAVALLTHSTYGRNGHEISVNQNSDYYTGAGRGLNKSEGGSGTSKIYNSTYKWSAIKESQKYNGIIGVLSSTTGNVYGIYDLSGGTYELTAAYSYQDGNNSIYNQGWAGLMTTRGDNTTIADSTKYATKYYSPTNPKYLAGKTGDSIKETYASGNACWFSDTINLLGTGTYTFSCNGGQYDKASGCGVFCNSSYNGAQGAFTFRCVLCP